MPGTPMNCMPLTVPTANRLLKWPPLLLLQLLLSRQLLQLLPH